MGIKKDGKVMKMKEINGEREKEEVTNGGKKDKRGYER